MELRKRWRANKILTIAIFCVIISFVLFLILFFPLRTRYYTNTKGKLGGGRYAIFTDNLGNEYRIDMAADQDYAEAEIEYDYDLDTYYYFTYKVYYSKNDEFTGEEDGYDMEHRWLNDVDVSSYYRNNFVAYAGGTEAGGQNFSIYAFSTRYDRNGEIVKHPKFELKVKIRNFITPPKMTVYLNKAGDYDSFLWGDKQFQEFKFSEENGTYIYTLTVTEGYTMNISGKSQAEEFDRVKVENAFTVLQQKGDILWITVTRSDPESKIRHFTLSVHKVEE